MEPTSRTIARPKPWHYLVYGTNLGIVSEEIANAAIAAIRNDTSRTVKDASTNLSPKVSAALVRQIRKHGHTAIQQDICRELAVFAKSIAPKSALLVARVEFSSLVHFRYWYLPHNPKDA